MLIILLYLLEVELKKFVTQLLYFYCLSLFLCSYLSHFFPSAFFSWCHTIFTIVFHSLHGILYEYHVCKCI